MRKHLAFGLAALTTLLGVTAARADVFIRVPFVTVRVGSPRTGVIVNPPVAPPVVIGQPIDVPPVVVPPPPPNPPPGSGEGRVGAPPAPVVVVQRAPTLDEFAKAFKPAPGKHEVTVLHPVTCEPVTVCFTLPEGCPKKVIVRPREIDFDYGRTDVSIRFVRGGRVRVTE